MLWVSAGRGPATRGRAQVADLTDAGSPSALVAGSDVVLSVCPPHAALQVARAARRPGPAGLYVDANAVAPAGARTIGAAVEGAGGRSVDGDLICGPVRPGGQPGRGRDRRLGLEDMCYAAWTKETSALLLTIRAAAAATKVTGGQAGCGCGDGCCGAATPEEPGFGAELYAALDRDALPDTALAASLGCGNPTAVAEAPRGRDRARPRLGRRHRRAVVGPAGAGPSARPHGLDMTEEMLALARANAAEAGATNVEILKGQIEAIPLPAATVGVVISSCVINLSTDKPAAFGRPFRVLRPGGRLGEQRHRPGRPDDAADGLPRGLLLRYGRWPGRPSRCSVATQ